MQRPKAVMLRAELRHCTWDSRDYMEGVVNVVEEMPVYYESRNLDYIPDPEWREKMRQTYNPARYIADCIAMTRNIAATWDLVSVTLDGIDVTPEVNQAWQKWYACRRQEFV